MDETLPEKVCIQCQAKLNLKESYHSVSVQCELMSVDSLEYNTDMKDEIYCGNRTTSQVRPFFERLNQLHKQNVYCDAVIVIGEKSWKCHQLILAASSYILHEAICHLVQKSQFGCIVLIKLPDSFNVYAMDVLIDLFYTGTCNFSPEVAYDVMVIADCLQVSSVMSQCVSFIDSLYGSKNYAYGTKNSELHKPLVTTISRETLLRMTDVEEGIQLTAVDMDLSNGINSKQNPLPCTRQNDNRNQMSERNQHLETSVDENISSSEQSSTNEILVPDDRLYLESLPQTSASVLDGNMDFSNLTKVASDAYEDLEIQLIKQANRCSSCSMVFDSKKKLTNHLRLKHKTKKYPCQFCEKSFKRKSDAKLHESRKHMLVKPFTCTQCNVTFSLKRQLRNHTKVHEEGHAFKCEVCGKTFISCEGYKHHTTHAHAQKTHLCDNAGCHSAYSSLKQLARHKLTCKNAATPSQQRLFQCEKCGETFRWSHLLQRHCNSVHLKLKPFKCEECYRSFNRKEQLEQHSATHTGKRDYNCTLCGKTFKQKSGLCVHKKTHSNEHKIICDVCGYNCHSLSVFRIHQRTHSNEKPFSCEKCSKSFKALKYLRRHEVVHDKVKTKKMPLTQSNDSVPLPSTRTSVITPVHAMSTANDSHQFLVNSPSSTSMPVVLSSSFLQATSTLPDGFLVAFTQPSSLTKSAVSVDDGLSIYFNQEKL